MDLVDKLLAAVPKDELGFEDIDKFWVATEKLAFPFTQRFKTKLYQLSSSTKKVSAQKRLSGASSVNSSAMQDDRHDDSDTDFDYDTSSSVSVVSAVSDGEDDDDLSSIEADESLVQAKSTRSSLASAKASLASSFAEVDTSLAETASVASTRSKRSMATSANSSTISAASSRRSSSATTSRLSNKDEDGEAAEEEDDDEIDDVDDVHADIDPQALLNMSATTARGRKSSLMSRDSQLLGDGIDSDDDKATSSGRRSSGTASGRRSSATTLATPTGKDEQGRRETRSTRSSLATPKDATPAGGAAALSSIKKSRRVSFESELPMDDDADLRLEAEDETQLTEHSSFQLSPEPSTVAASSRASSATKSTRASTTATSSLVEESTVVEEEEEEPSASTMRVDESDAVDESEASASRDMTTTTVASSLPPPADDYDDADAYADGHSDEEATAEASALSHGTDASGVSRRGKRRKSSASEASLASVTTTPRRMSRSAFDLSTPASNEFKGGRRLSDSTFIATDREDADDDDDEDAAVSDGAASSSASDDDTGRGGRRRGGRRPRPSSMSEAGTSPEAATDVSLSFLDQSYLNTISSANKKYAGHKVRAEAALQRRTKQELLQNRRHQRELAAILSDESDVDRLVARAMRQKQAARRTKTTDGDDDEADEDVDEAAAAAGGAMDDDEDARHSRRSRRATKGMRFAFWKNERPIYDEGVLVDVVHAEPTPKKPRRQQRRTAGGGTKATAKRGVKRRLIDSDDEDGDAAFDATAANAASKKPRRAANAAGGDEDDDTSIALPTDVSYLEPTTHETLQVWDDYYDRPAPQQVVYVTEAQPAPQPLPVTGERPASRMDDVGYAAHYFHAPEMAGGTMSGWMAGAVELPPHAIKDAEGVGKYLQVFFVASAQAHALEFGLADPSQDAWVDGTAQRLLLSAGDSFYVPPGNIYRLENHSTTTTARLFWMIVYPIEDAAVVRGSSVSEHTVVSGVSY